MFYCNILIKFIMTILDLLLAIFLGVFIYLGWKRGVVREAATLVGVLIGIWAAVHFSRLIATLLGLTGEYAILITFFIIFIGALVLASLLGRTAEGVIKALKMNLPNKVAGAALGLLKALCISAVILNGVVLLDKNDSLIPQGTRERSLLYTPVFDTGNELLSSLNEFVEEHRDLQEGLEKRSAKAAEEVGKGVESQSGEKGGGR